MPTIRGITMNQQLQGNHLAANRHVAEFRGNRRSRPTDDDDGRHQRA